MVVVVLLRRERERAVGGELVVGAMKKPKSS